VTLPIGDGRDGEDDEQLQLVEFPLDQFEIEDALKRLRSCPEADKGLKYTTRPGGSERSARRFRAKFRNAESTKPLTAFNFPRTTTANDNLSEGDQKHKDRKSEPCETEERDNLYDNADADSPAFAEECYESTGKSVEFTLRLYADGAKRKYIMP
ncbi:hypothetical protein V1525DRAFT_392159, partial [Lipomyces kononenkoae]